MESPNYKVNGPMGKVHFSLRSTVPLSDAGNLVERGYRSGDVIPLMSSQRVPIADTHSPGQRAAIQPGMKGRRERNGS